MEAYKIITNYNNSLSNWLSTLPFEKDEEVEVIVISTKKESEKKPLTQTDLDNLGTIHLSENPLEYQNKMRDEW